MSPASRSDSVTAIVLAAGRSSRMGKRNKLLLPYKGRTVVATVVHALSAAGFRRILVVVGHQRGRVMSALAGWPVKFCENPEYRQGLSTSLRAGVRAAPPAAPWLLFALGDMPAVRASTFRRLRKTARAQEKRAILVPTSSGKRGNPVVFSAHYREELLAATGDSGARRLLAAHAEAVVEVPVADPGIFQDLDTPAEAGISASARPRRVAALSSSPRRP